MAMNAEAEHAMEALIAITDEDNRRNVLNEEEARKAREEAAARERKNSADRASVKSPTRSILRSSSTSSSRSPFVGIPSSRKKVQFDPAVVHGDEKMQTHRGGDIRPKQSRPVVVHRDETTQNFRGSNACIDELNRTVMHHNKEGQNCRGAHAPLHRIGSYSQGFSRHSAREGRTSKAAETEEVWDAVSPPLVYSQRYLTGAKIGRQRPTRREAVVLDQATDEKLSRTPSSEHCDGSNATLRLAEENENLEEENGVGAVVVEGRSAKRKYSVGMRRDDATDRSREGIGVEGPVRHDGSTRQRVYRDWNERALHYIKQPARTRVESAADRCIDPAAVGQEPVKSSMVVNSDKHRGWSKMAVIWQSRHARRGENGAQAATSVPGKSGPQRTSSVRLHHYRRIDGPRQHEEGTADQSVDRDGYGDRSVNRTQDTGQPRKDEYLVARSKTDGAGAQKDPQRSLSTRSQREDHSREDKQTAADTTSAILSDYELKQHPLFPTPKPPIQQHPALRRRETHHDLRRRRSHDVLSGQGSHRVPLPQQSSHPILQQIHHAIDELDRYTRGTTTGMKRAFGDDLDIEFAGLKEADDTRAAWKAAQAVQALRRETEAMQARWQKEREETEAMSRDRDQRQRRTTTGKVQRLCARKGRLVIRGNKMS